MSWCLLFAATGAIVTSAEKKKDKLKLDKLSKISSNQNPPQVSIAFNTNS
jgi:hypothetical protein